MRKRQKHCPSPVHTYTHTHTHTHTHTTHAHTHTHTHTQDTPIKTCIHTFIKIHKGKIFRKTNTSYPLIRARTCMCTYQGVRNVSFSENFSYVLNEWSLAHMSYFTAFIDIFFVRCWKSKREKKDKFFFSANVEINSTFC